MLQPLKNKIILELMEKEKTTESGIVLMSADREEANKGKVIAVGKDCEYLTEGNTILPDWNKAQKTKYEDKEYYIVSEDDVVMIFEE
jgi:co-chaperonin GroES (HSP10)